MKADDLGGQNGRSFESKQTIIPKKTIQEKVLYDDPCYLYIVFKFIALGYRVRDYGWGVVLGIRIRN